MRIKKNPVFIFSLVFYIIHQLLERNGIKTHFVIDCWLDDILCLPVILGVALYSQRKFIYKDPDYIFSRLHVVFTVIYCTFIFELFLPKVSSKYTADVADVIAYSIGGLIFYFFINVNDQAEKV